MALLVQLAGRPKPNAGSSSPVLDCRVFRSGLTIVIVPGWQRADLDHGLNSSRFVRLLAEFAAGAESATSAEGAEPARRAARQGGTATGARAASAAATSAATSATTSDKNAAAASKLSFAERLGLWLDWTDAIALAAALTLPTARPTARPAAVDRSAAAVAVEVVVAELERVRHRLADAIVADGLFKAGHDRAIGSTPPTGTALETAPGFAVYRRACLAHQRAMAAGIAPLRGQVRLALASRSPALGRLAALDAVLDQALGERERHLLAAVPRLLEQHFERLRQAHAVAGLQAPGLLAAASQATGSQAPGSPAPWLADYGRAVQQVLLAELDVRLQPVEGMVEAMGHEVTRLQ